MAKRYEHFLKILLLMAVLSIFFSNFVLGADSIGDKVGEFNDDLTDVKTKIDDVKSNIADSNAQSSFLMQQWAKLIDKTPLGDLLKSFGIFMSNLDPFFDLIIGQKFSFSLIFSLSLIIWVFLLYLSYNLLPVLDVYIPSKHAKYLKFVLFILLFMLISVIRVPSFFASIIINLISYSSYFTVKFIVTLLVAVAIFLLFKYSALVKKKLLINADKVHLKKVEKKVEEEKEIKENNKKKKSKKDEEDDEDEELDEEAREEIEGLGDED